MSQSNDGKYLEAEVEKWVSDLSLATFLIKRLPDTRSARNIITAQSADFLCTRAYFGAFHIECKSSGSKKEELSMFRQYPVMRMWENAGTPGFVLIHYYILGIFKLVQIKELDAIGLSGKKWKLGSISSFKEADDGFNRIMQELCTRTVGER